MTPSPIDPRVQTATCLPSQAASPTMLPARRSSRVPGTIKPQLTLLLVLLSAPTLIRADARFDTYFASSVKWERNPVTFNWDVDFVPTDTAKYAYEVQVAGKASGDPNKKPSPVLGCTKFAASYRKKLDVKDVNGEIGISNQKAFEAKLSGHATTVDVFGGTYNRVPAPWYQPPVLEEVHLRVAVYQHNQLAFTTGWYGAPAGDILNWKWPASCSWVQVQK